MKNKIFIIVITAVLLIGVSYTTYYLKEKKETNIPVVKKTESFSYFAHEVQTHLYYNNLPTLTEMVIESTQELDNYKEKYNDLALEAKLDEYKTEYFKENVLVVIIKTENSGSNQNKISNVTKTLNTLNINIERIVTEIGTSDMSTWFLLLEIQKQDYFRNKQNRNKL